VRLGNEGQETPQLLVLERARQDWEHERASVRLREESAARLHGADEGAARVPEQLAPLHDACEQN
jgi:hypothetical protein